MKTSRGTTPGQALTVAAHGRFRETIAPPPAQAFDEIDEAAADPIHDRPPQLRGSRKTRDVLRVLDSLESQTGRATH